MDRVAVANLDRQCSVFHGRVGFSGEVSCVLQSLGRHEVAHVRHLRSVFREQGVRHRRHRHGVRHHVARGQRDFSLDARILPVHIVKSVGFRRMLPDDQGEHSVLVGGRGLRLRILHGYAVGGQDFQRHTHGRLGYQFVGGAVSHHSLVAQFLGGRSDRQQHEGCEEG